MKRALAETLAGTGDASRLEHDFGTTILNFGFRTFLSFRFKGALLSFDLGRETPQFVADLFNPPRVPDERLPVLMSDDPPRYPPRRMPIPRTDIEHSTPYGRTIIAEMDL